MSAEVFFSATKGHLRSVKNYRPGKPLEELEREQGIRHAVKMASNENALGPSPKAVLAMRRALTHTHRYPDGWCFFLRRRLSRFLKVPAESLVFGNGSDELLVFAARAFVSESDEVIIADPTFLIYEIACSVENARVVRVPMKNFHYDLQAMAGKINERTKLIFIANPDNPVGTYVNEKALRVFLTRVPGDVAVVLDEAYYEFGRIKKDYPDSLKLLKDFPNLVVTRTFSKAYGLAGLRIGYSVSSEEIAGALNKVREPFNVNLLAQEAAVAALDDKTHVAKTVRLVNAGREWLTKELRHLGLRCVDTVANFILFDLKREAGPVYEKLLTLGVIVRPMGSWGLKTFMRVTIGTASDNRQFLHALKTALKQ